MRTISRRTYILYALMAVFFILLFSFLYQYLTNYQTWSSTLSNRHLYPQSGSYANAGMIVDRNGVTLAQTEDGKRRYASSKNVRMAMLHVVGDSERFINTSIQKNFLPDLVGYSLIDGYYRNEAGLEGNSIELTLDSKACETAYAALEGRKGTVGVMNYETGEMICMVSTPAFDPENKPDLDNDPRGKYEGAYMNRLLSSKYPPGSTFKLVTAAAAIDNVSKVKKRTFTCEGKKTFDGGTVVCNAVHGTIDFDTALAKSCNVAFSELAVEMGKKTMTEYAAKVGFNQPSVLEGIETTSGKFEMTDANQANLGWAGIGQYTVEANPYQMLMFMGAVANGGLEVKPYVIGSVRSPAGIPVRIGVAARGERMLKASTAKELKRMMRNNVKTEYGDKRFGKLNVCAKTGTAEVSGGKSHSWFIGFVEDEAHPYAFVVVAENSGSGIGTSANVAAKVLARIAI